jgi:integrase/recombinase XerD
MINGKRKIGLQFYPDKVINALVKQIPEVRWSPTFSMVILPNNKDNLQLVYNTFKGVAWINGSSFYGKSKGKEPEIIDMKFLRNKNEQLPAKKQIPANYIDTLERKHYAINTAKLYLSHFAKFISHFPKIPLYELTDLEVNEYLLHLTKNDASKSYINSSVNAIKFYFEVVLGMPNRFYNVDRPRKDHKLPIVISHEEVLEMIKVTKNIKHRCMIELLYSSGMRNSEIINLRIKDIDSKRMLINIKDAKGNKDRNTQLGNKMLESLRAYFLIYRPKVYLFEGQAGGKYSPRSLGKVVVSLSSKAKIRVKVTPHVLRHCFATHLLENGADLRQIQSLMGHESIKTTEIYLHVATKHLSTIKNLLD